MAPRSKFSARYGETTASDTMDELADIMPVPAGKRGPRPVEILLVNIEPNPHQYRTYFDPVALNALAHSISTNGFNDPLLVRPHPRKSGMYQLVYGERRWRAAQSAGLHKVWCLVADYNDGQMLTAAGAENLHHENPRPLEWAAYVAAERTARKLSIEGLADFLKKPKNWVEDIVALIDIADTHPDLYALVDEHRDVPLRAIRELKKLTVEDRAPLVDALREGTITQQQVRDQVRRIRHGEDASPVLPAAPVALDPFAVSPDEARVVLDDDNGDDAAVVQEATPRSTHQPSSGRTDGFGMITEPQAAWQRAYGTMDRILEQWQTTTAYNDEPALAQQIASNCRALRDRIDTIITIAESIGTGDEE